MTRTWRLLAAGAVVLAFCLDWLAHDVLDVAAAVPMANRSPLVFRPVVVPTIVETIRTPRPTRSTALGIITEPKSERRPAQPGAPGGAGSRRSLGTSGTATWYGGTYSSGERVMYAAVGSWRWGDTPYRVTVCHAGHCVDVVVRDHCHACEDGSPLIDLSPTAFGRLAPLELGRIRVTIDG